MNDLTAFRRDLLVVIAGLDDPSGQELKDELAEYYDELYPRNLYTNLDRLVSMGLVKKGERDGRTNFYRLKRRGRRVLADRREWTREQLADDAPPRTERAVADGGGE